jgi:hypothetical protein
MKRENKKILKKGYRNDSIQDCDNPYELVRRAVKAQENSENEEDIEKCLRSGDKLFTH